MSKDDLSTARELVKGKRWQWLAGMLAKNLTRAVGSGDDYMRLVDADWDRQMWVSTDEFCVHVAAHDGAGWVNSTYAPDLDDPLTRMGLWLLLAEAVNADEDRWVAELRANDTVFLMETPFACGDMMPVADALLYVWAAMDKAEGVDSQCQPS